MSQYPQYPQQPLSYHQPYIPQPARPRAVSGVAITGIVVGALFLLCGAIGAVQSVMHYSSGGMSLGWMDSQTIPVEKSILLYNMAAAVLGVLLWLWLLIGSVMALKLNPAGRKALIIWSWVMILEAVIATVVQYTWVQPATAPAFKQAIAQRPGGQQAAGMMDAMLVATPIVLLVLTVILPIIILVLWNKPHVKAAFADGGVAQAGGYGAAGYPQQAYPQQGYPQQGGYPPQQ